MNKNPFDNVDFTEIKTQFERLNEAIQMCGSAIHAEMGKFSKRLGGLDSTVASLQSETKEAVQRTKHNGRLISELTTLHAEQMVRDTAVGDSEESFGAEHIKKKYLDHSEEALAAMKEMGIISQDSQDVYWGLLGESAGRSLAGKPTDQLNGLDELVSPQARCERSCNCTELNKYTVVSSNSHVHDIYAKWYATTPDGGLQFFDYRRDVDGELVASFSNGWVSVVKQ